MAPPNPSRDPAANKHAAGQPNRSSGGKPFLGVLFRCCNQYARIYRNAQQTAYAGNCPKCGKRLQVPIGSGGTGQRFFGTRG